MANQRVLLEHQRQAIMLKLEEDLSDSGIAQRLGFTRQAVHRWWKMPHVLREFGRQKQAYNDLVLPHLVGRMITIRDNSIAGILAYLQLDKDGNPKEKLRPHEYIEMFKVANEVIEKEQSKLDPDKENEANAQRVVDSIAEVLSPDDFMKLVQLLRENERRKRNRKSIIQTSAAGDPGELLSESGASEL